MAVNLTHTHKYAHAYSHLYTQTQTDTYTHKLNGNQRIIKEIIIIIVDVSVDDERG